jgi:ASC-1-like (ASCH) protein
MTGKIFSESNNIYQDQASILFDYYSKAAEKIVSEEERIEKEIESLEEEKAMRRRQISGLWTWFLTIILFFVYFIKKSNLERLIVDLDERIAKLEKQHKDIFRDYKVTKLGVAYVPIAEQISYEDKSFIVDYTGRVGESEVTLQLSRQNDLLVETIADLENLSSQAPIVETSEETETIETDDYSTSIQELNQHDYFGKLERSLRTISYCMDDLDTTSVSLPLVPDMSDYLQQLGEYATSEIPAGYPVIEVFDRERYAGSINKFKELNKLKDSLSTKTAQFEDVLKGLMVTMANSVQAISALKVASTDKVIFESNKVLYQILKAPYNHYSPMLEYEEIERIRNEKFDYSESAQGYEPFQLKPSSKVRYNLASGMWTAEDGSVTNFPFGVHQIYEEIVAPVVQNLMNENRIERQHIYNHIKDQKIEYLNKWHQDTDSFYRANRAESADVINLMQASLREYVAAYNTLVSLQKTEESMVQSGGSLDATVVEVVDNSQETLAAFELQSREFQRVQSDFESYMERLKEDIDFKAEKFGHIEYYDARLRDGNANALARAAGEVHDLDARRKPLAAVNPLFAKSSDLLPVPQVEDITFEHISLNLPVLAKVALEELDSTDKMLREEPGGEVAPESDIVEEEFCEDDEVVGAVGESEGDEEGEEGEDVEESEDGEDLDEDEESKDEESEDDEEVVYEDNDADSEDWDEDGEPESEDDEDDEDEDDEDENDEDENDENK